MRVELIYAPGCRTYQKALHYLEMVIAEEQLPLPIELVAEGKPKGRPKLRIDGEYISAPKALQCIETLRETLSSKWYDLTVSPLKII